MPPLRVYLCDLTHNSILLSSDTIPINIGFAGSYVKKCYGKDVEISLFKYPEKAITAIRDFPPDIIGLSNYSWNSNLSEHVAGIAKQANQKVITVQGGPNFPERDELQLSFLLSRPSTDFFIEFEGERAFAGLVGSALSYSEGGPPPSDVELPGCVSIIPSTRHDLYPTLRKGARPLRIKELDEIPSPYLNGMLDQFFDGRLVPFLETNRGCPFACTFCHTGHIYYNKINTFSIDRLKAEIEYVGKRIAAQGITHLYLADTNFGMYARDKEICDELARAQEVFGWPLHMYATTGKNNKDRVIEITKVLGKALSVYMSVQSMDATVLKNIRRSNIRLDDYLKINKTLTDRGQFTRGEVIIGLPGETKETFTRGIEQLMDTGVSCITSYSLILLDGTPFKDPAYAKQYEIVGKYRLVPLNFGEYAGSRVFDVEETGIANKHMSFDDYLWMRGLSFIVEALYNNRPFSEFFKYASVHGVKPFSFVMRAYAGLKTAPPTVQSVFAGFMDETRNELWDSEEQLREHYCQDQNYNSLLNGESGGNVINRYKSASLLTALDGWIEFLAKLCVEIGLESRSESKSDEVRHEVNAIKQFIRNKLTGLLTQKQNDSVCHMKADFDILDWMEDEDNVSLTDFKTASQIEYEFYYTPEQLAVQKDMLKRYGSDLNGLSRIVRRLSSIEVLFRHCRKCPAESRAPDLAFGNEQKPGLSSGNSRRALS
jgi:radical SAM superfamily enzyme YgiQ (UPF0313 family)